MRRYERARLISLTLTVVGCLLILCGATVAGAAADVPPDLGVGALVDAAKLGKVLPIIAAAIMVLVNLFKSPALGGLVAKIPARLRVIIPIALGGVAGILSSVIGGMSWPEALVVGLLSGPSAVFLHEGFVEALMGQSKSRAPEDPQ